MENVSAQGEWNKRSVGEKLIRAIAVGVLLLLALSLFAHTIIDTDIWWHLRTGQYIIENRAVPRVDMYSYTAGGNVWIDLHWLFEVVTYGVYGAWGSYGLSLFFITVFSSAFVMLWIACRPMKYRFPAVLFFALALMACSSRFISRPEAFTFLMIGIYMVLLTRYERGGARRLIYLLIPLQALWTNLQGLFVIGLVIISAYLLDGVAMGIVARLKGEPPDAYSAGIRTLLVVFVGVALACLLNPYGTDGLLFPLTLFTRIGGMQNVFAASIAEFQPPFSGYNLTGSIKWFGAFLAASAAVMALDHKNWKLSHLLIYLGLGYLALNARRNIPVFVIAFLPLAARHAENLVNGLAEARDGRHRGIIGRVELVGCVLLSAAILIQIRCIVTNKYYMANKQPERFGFGFKEQTFPHGAFVFLKEKQVRGPFFNNMDVGGLFIWELFPEEKVFIDARLEVNSAEIFSDYRRATSDAYAFAGLSGKYGFNAVIISHTAQDALYLIPVLYGSPDWALVYLDPIAAIFLRVNPEHGEIINAGRVDLAHDEIALVAPHDTLNDGGPRALRNILGTIAAMGPSDVETQNRFNLGLVFLMVGQYERAVEQLASAVELMPSSASAHYNLGLAYERMGRKESALHHYREVVGLDRRHANAHAGLARIYDEQGLDDEAEREYRLSVKWGGDRPILLYNLGAFYYRRGDLEAARTHWQRALEIEPSFTPASEALKKID
jgi:tetratricopeptide (TPR) repeat protein